MTDRFRSKPCPFCHTTDHRMYDHCPVCMSLDCQTPDECLETLQECMFALPPSSRGELDQDPDDDIARWEWEGGPTDD